MPLIAGFSTVRSRDGTGRITYNSQWSPSKPWATYYRGSAEQMFSTLREAMDYMYTRWRCRFAKKADEYLAEFEAYQSPVEENPDDS